MATEPARPRFSIIIPLEFHRGAALDCVRGWTRQTGFPRTDYEIVLAVPDGFPDAELQALRALLLDGDRVLGRPEQHDVPLCDAAARAAGGAVFFFTESHCVPEPDVLAIAARALSEHPEWSGFSVASQRIVHNRLSIVEADMFEGDIARHTAPGHWCKILDQCFVVRREAYFAAGGFDPELGHFAEFMLAARCHRMGLLLGYVPEGKINHVYPGDLREWRAFTEDFVRGEITALARSDADGFIDLFGFVPEWAARESWHPSTARRMVGLCLRDPRGGAMDAGLALVRWLPAALGGQRLRRVRARVASRLTWWRAHWDLWAGSMATLRRSVARSMGALTHAERVRWTDHWMEMPRRRGSAGAWEAGKNASLRSAGFHPPGREVVWSEPAAMIQLPLEDGRYEIVVEWLAALAEGAEPRFYLNERAIATVTPRAGEARMTVTVTAADGARLAWTCQPQRSHGRRLGLPLRTISWRPTSRAS